LSSCIRRKKSNQTIATNLAEACTHITLYSKNDKDNIFLCCFTKPINWLCNLDFEPVKAVVFQSILILEIYVPQTVSKDFNSKEYQNKAFNLKWNVNKANHVSAISTSSEYDTCSFYSLFLNIQLKCFNWKNTSF